MSKQYNDLQTLKANNTISQRKLCTFFCEYVGEQALKATKTIGTRFAEHTESQLRYQGCVTPCGHRVIETARSALK